MSITKPRSATVWVEGEATLLCPLPNLLPLGHGIGWIHFRSILCTARTARPTSSATLSQRTAHGRVTYGGVQPRHAGRLLDRPIHAIRDLRIAAWSNRSTFRVRRLIAFALASDGLENSKIVGRQQAALG